MNEKDWGLVAEAIRLTGDSSEDFFVSILPGLRELKDTVDEMIRDYCAGVNPNIIRQINAASLE